MFVGEIGTGSKGTNRRGCNCVCELGSPPNLSKRKRKTIQKKQICKGREHNPSIPYSVPSLYTQGHARVYTHTHTIMHPFWHMTIYFPLSNERQAEGMAHILHNFKSQTFFCTCIKLENQLTPQHHLPEALLHISGPSGTPGGHYIPCGKLFFLPTKLPLAYSRQKYTVNPQVWAKAPSLRGYT